MIGGTAAYHDAILARVDDPRRKALLAHALEDSDRALETMLRSEANQRDAARKREMKTKPLAKKKARG